MILQNERVVTVWGQEMPANVRPAKKNVILAYRMNAGGRGAIFEIVIKSAFEIVIKSANVGSKLGNITGGVLLGNEHDTARGWQ
jgi:hypothetical protein